MRPSFLRSSPIKSSLRSFEHASYRSYWWAQLVSLIGTWMQTVAQGWLLHRLTGSALMLGYLGAAQFLPVMFFSLWAGVVTDRVDKRRLLAVTQSLLLFQSLVLAILVLTGRIEAWMVISLALAGGAVNAFDLPARQAFIVDLVGKDDLPNAIALNSAAFNTARVLGPAVAGVFIATAGESACFFANTLSFAPILVVLGRLRFPDRPRILVREVFHRSLVDGVRYSWGQLPIRNLLLLLGVTTCFGFQYTVLLPVYARDILRAGSGAYAALATAFGLGSLSAAVSMTRAPDRPGLRRNLFLGLGIATVALAVFAWSRWLPLTALMGFFAGFGLILYVASTNTLLQITTGDAYRGRVMSLYTFMFAGTAPLGALASGWIAEKFGAPVATTFSAASLGAGAIWVFFRLRSLARREAAATAGPAVSEEPG